MKRRLMIALTTLALTVPLVLLTSAPAQAGAFDGDATNWLSSSYTVKIATFSGSNLTERCPVDGGATYNCRTYWLPYGRSDDQINGTNWDTDAVMVENSSYIVERWGGTSSHWVSARIWTKFSSIENATCFYDGAPICSIE